MSVTVISVSTTGKFSMVKVPSSPVVAVRSPAVMTAPLSPVPSTPMTLPPSATSTTWEVEVIVLSTVSVSAAASCCAVRVSLPSA